MKECVCSVVWLKHFSTDQNKMISFQFTLKSHNTIKYTYSWLSCQVHLPPSHTIFRCISFWSFEAMVRFILGWMTEENGMTNTLKKTEKYSVETVRNYNMIKICSGVRCSMVPITTTAITATAHAYAYGNGNDTKNKREEKEKNCK